MQQQPPPYGQPSPAGSPAQQMPGGQQIPPAVYQLAETSQLGSFQARYQPLNPLAVIGAVIGVIILDLILATVIYNQATVIYNRGYIAPMLYILLILLGILPILLIVYTPIGIAQSNVRVYTFTNGLVRAKGGQTDVVRWDQVEAVWQHIFRRYTTPYHTYTVRRSDGATFKFNTVLRNIAHLGQTLQQEVTRVLLPRAIAAYNAGNAIPFGTVSVSVQGISHGRETLVWKQIQGVEAKEGYVSVKKAGKLLAWVRLRVSTIPNVYVFLGLVNYARTGQR